MKKLWNNLHPVTKMVVVLTTFFFIAKSLGTNR